MSLFKHYVIGDLLWAKCGNFPFWPCMISYDPYNGKYSKVLKIKNTEYIVYHVQYFGYQVQHGWTKPGMTFAYEGEEKFHEKKKMLIDQATNNSAKKSVLLKYSVPVSYQNLWSIAVQEAEIAVKLERPERFESLVFKYETKPSVTISSASNKRRSKWGKNPVTKKRKISIDSNCSDKDGKLCKICESLDAELTCSGGCSSSFHKECLGLLCAPENFQCIFCESGLRCCVVCNIADVSLTKCNKCDNHFHGECLKDYACIDDKKSICPSHVCLSCFNENPRNVTRKSPFIRCFNCPNVFHSKDCCVPVGAKRLSVSFIKCPDHYSGKNRVSTLPTLNCTYCTICSHGGELICCDACPNSYHVECLDVPVPTGDFFCEDCKSKKYLYEGMIVWAKTGKFRWWPAEIVSESDLPENIKNLAHNDGEFPICFFGTNEYYWTHRGRVIPYTDQHKSLKGIKNKQKTITVQYNTSLIEARDAFDLYEQERQLRKNFNCKPDAYKHIKVNRAVPPAQIFVHDAISALPCSCDPEKPNPCSSDSQCLNRSMQIECHPDVCRAKERCENQNFQKRQYISYKIMKTKNSGWGLQTKEFIKRGSFVIEYVGEIITHEEYRKRVVQMAENEIQNYYFLHLDSRRIIDAGPKGNFARFINHSCDPNCEMVKWSVNGDARIGIFAVKDIEPGEELTFHYHSDSIQFQQICNCGASNCEGFIGGNRKNGKKK